MIDEPGTTDVVIYKVYCKATHNYTTNFYINRTVNDHNNGGDGIGYEHGISTSSVKEFSTFTHNIAEQKVQGRVLETLAGVCDGRSVTVSSGTYTLENVTTGQDLNTTTWVKATGSLVNYKPPPGTRVVKFTYRYAARAWSNNYDLWHQILYLDNTAVTFSQETIRPPNAQNYESMNEYSAILSIGGTNDLANGKLASWDTLKTIEVRMSAIGNRRPKLHASNHSGPQASGTDLFIPPQVTITAIGEENLVYNLTNQYSITEGQVLETLAGVCDGRSVTVSSGTYSLDVVTVAQELTTSYADVTGSSINYKPPPGTKQIIYKFYCLATRSSGTYFLLHSKCLVDGQECTDFRVSMHQDTHSHEFVVFNYVFNIGIKDEIASGNFLTWNEKKTIKVSAREYGSSDTARLHYNTYWDGTNPGDVTKPRLEITAIGRGVIEGTIENLYSSKVNMDHKTMTETASLSVAAYGAKTEIESLRLTIVPVHRDSKMELNYSLFNSASLHNFGFVVSRTVGGTETLLTSDHMSGSYPYDLTFMPGGIYSDYGSQCRTTTHTMIDEPVTTDTVVYKVYGRSSGHNAVTLYMNRTGSDTDDGNHEHGLSTSSVKELPQQTTLHNPRYNSVIEQEGQTLETLAGVCDGRTISVSSGTYTLGNVSAEQQLTTSWVDITGTPIDYKPPPGTKYISYKLEVYRRWGPTASSGRFYS